MDALQTLDAAGLFKPVEMIDLSEKFTAHFAPHVKKAVSVDGHIVHVCSAQYRLVPNAEILPEIVSSLEAEFGNITPRVRINRDAKFFADLRMDEFSSGQVDSVYPVVSFQNSYDGTTKLRVSGGLERLVCTNGMAVPQKWNGKNFSVAFKHTENLMAHLPEIIQMGRDLCEEYAHIYGKMEVMRKRTVQPTKEVFSQLIAGTSFPKTRLNQAIERMEVEMNLLSSGPNMFLAYQALNYVLNHDTTLKMSEDRRRICDVNLQWSLLQLQL